MEEPNNNTAAEFALADILALYDAIPEHYRNQTHGVPFNPTAENMALAAALAEWDRQYPLAAEAMKGTS